MGAWPAFLLLLSCGRCGEPESSTLIDFGTRPRTSTTGAEIFGLNEAVSIPEAWIKNGLIQPEDEPKELAEDARWSRELGVQIVRGNSPVYPYLDHLSLEARDWDWTRSDHWVQTIQEAGLEGLLVIGPWPGNRTGAYTQSYLPPDLDAYDEYVRRVVERYDGDGSEDMPGLKEPIRYWEIDNEPDLHNSAPARGTSAPPNPATFETPEEYAEILIRSARVIRENHPDPVILSAGLFRPHHATGKAYLQAALSVPGAKEAFDVLSLHCYFDQDGLDVVTRTMSTAADLLPGVPVWITETGVPSIGKSAHIDTEWQAEMVAAVYGAFLAAGADRIFWHTLTDPPNPKSHMRRAPFASHSLLKSAASGPAGPGQRVIKPAGVVYQNLAKAMADVSPDSITEIEAIGGRLLQTDQGWLAFWGSPELPEGYGTISSLVTGDPVPPENTVDAPAWIYRVESSP